MGKIGTVVAVDGDGDPKVHLDGEAQAQQRFGSEFKIVEKATFGIGDRVRGKETGKLGTVVGVDGDGDPKVVIDGGEEVKQRFGSEFEIVEKKIKTKDDSSDDDKKKKKKKKKKSSSSSSSPSA